MLSFLLLGCIPDLHSPEGATACGDEPVDNSWPAEEPPASLVAGSFDDGEVVPDACLADQFGAEASIWQFYGRLFVLDISTMWCSPCQDLAEGLQVIADTYGPEGFSYLTVLPQNVDSEVPAVEDLAYWAERYGILEPVLADAVSYTGRAVSNNAYPRVLLVDRDLTVIETISPATDETIVAAIEANL